ncbi:MFS transporter [Caballeronia sp. AZ7_KS35]|uniref:MFS transporter n=1 Tax=Caballeronia sp. AZ7_KS35 TaxID=2921762 RepID=UPI002028B986|nr:MFS transporter [Caballeronia sp. AZ7_KS35]
MQWSIGNRRSLARSEHKNGDTMAETTWSALIDERPIGRFQVMIAAIGMLVLLCEGFDLQVIAYLMPQIVAEWHIDATRQGSVLSAGYVGMLVGFLALAPLASRFGLRNLVAVCLVGMGALNLATVFAQTATSLIVLRIAVGLTLGGVVPPTLALVAEYFPARHRSAVVSTLYLGTTSGILSAGALAWLILPRWGWRGTLIVGGCAPILIALIVWLLCPESLNFLLSGARRGKERARSVFRKLYPAEREDPLPANAAFQKVSRGTLVDLFKEHRLLGTLMLWAALSLNAVVYFFALSWMPLILVKTGAAQQDAILVSTLANIGGMAAVVTGFLMDRFGNARVVMLYFVAGAVFVLVLGVVLSSSLLLIAPAAFCLGFCVSGLQKGVSALAVRFYPPMLRSAGLGWVLGIGRSGAVVGPLLPGLLMQHGWLPGHIFYAMAVPMLLGASSISVLAKWPSSDDARISATKTRANSSG